MTQLANANPTMTSLELVEFINADRKQRAEEAGAGFPSKGFAELRHDDCMRKVPEVLGAGVSENFRIPYRNPQNGQTYTIYRFQKREACLMAMSYSYDLQAKVFDRMTALEVASAPTMTHSYADAMTGLDIVCRSMNLEGSAKLGMFRKGTELTAPHLLPALPVYAIDAPAGTPQTSSVPTTSLTTALKAAGANVSAAHANVRLAAAGILEHRSRPSATKGVKYFWVLTAEGLKYGKNIVSPSNARETQPHYFTATIGELLRIATGD